MSLDEFASLPRLLGPPAFSGVIRHLPQDFQVEEIPAYLPSGEGEHLFLLIEKISLTTEEVVRELARQLSVPRSSVGSAGLKDRRALTRQWLSLPAQAEDKLAGFYTEGVRILEARRHRNKLRTGHLRGNRFRLLVRGLADGAEADVRRRLEQIERRGFPDYFGPQRFGRNARNLDEGLKILSGNRKIRDHRRLRFILSAVQSWLFNRVLAERIRRGWFDRALAGDLLAFDTGRFFLCREPIAEQPRLDRLEIHPTGPLYGPEMSRPQGDADALEREILAGSGLGDADFQRFASFTPGGRRPLRAVPKQVRIEPAAEGPWLQFSLPAGAYATSLLGELLQVRDAGEEAGEPSDDET